jgi:hypothetical protein
MKIGIFIPFSRSNPSATPNIIAGIKAGFAATDDRDVEIHDYAVTSSRRMITEVLNRAFYMDEVDIAIGNIGYCVLPQILKDVDLTGKLLFLTSIGADIVREGDRHPNVFRNSLFYWQGLYQTGYDAIRDHGGVFTATTTLETGFDSYLAYLTGCEDAGCAYVPFHQCDERDYVFRAEPCIEKIKASGCNVVAALASGDNAAKIYRDVILNAAGAENRKVVLSPFYHDNSVLKSIGDLLIGTESYFGWADSLLDVDTHAVRDFLEAWKKSSKKTPDAFSVLGYETAKMICSAMDKCGRDEFDANALAAALEGTGLESPRGTIAMDPAAHTVNGMIYKRTLEKRDNTFRTAVTKAIMAQKDGDSRLNGKISIHGSRWLNDYLFI